MKKIKLVLLILLIRITCLGQNFSISNDKMNVFYIGVGNPVSFAVEGIKNTSLSIKSVNGKLTKEEFGYTFRPDSVGKSEIILFAKSKGKLQEVGRSAFRSKNLPPPTFHIGSNSKTKSKTEVAAQEYVRAELEGFDINARFKIETYKVCIFSADSCKYLIQEYRSGKISPDLKEKIQALQDSDTVLFKDIYVTGPDGKTILIEPLLLSIRN